MDAVAEYIGLPPVQVYEVASFYSMFETHRCGRHHVSVCTNISCMLRGAEDILGHVEKKLGVKPGETTADGMFTLVEEECLAACADAPMMICGDKYFMRLDTGKVDSALDELRKHPRSEH
jgi:NADH-quinone oxidoreductase subunit E